MAALGEFLQNVSYFNGLSSSELDAVSRFFFERETGKGETIVWEREPVDTLYLVAVGAVKYFKTSEEGKEQIIQIVLPTDSFNDVAIFDGGLSPASAESMSRVRLYGISKRDMERVMIDHPQILLNSLKVLSAKMRHLLQLVEDLSFRHVINRIARVLVDYADDGTGPKPRLTQQEIAAIVGTAREVVGRSLKTLQEEGTIKMERNRLVILNKEALKQMASSLG